MRRSRFCAVLLLVAFPAQAFAQVAALPGNFTPATPPPVARHLDLSPILTAAPVVPLPMDALNEHLRVFAASLRPSSDRQEAQQIGCADSEAKGRADAETRKTNWVSFGIGVPSGFFLPFIGWLIPVGVAAATKPAPRTIPSGVESACYSSGYISKARKKDMLSGVLGGLVGTAAFFVVALIANDN
jgi:tetrahydromethanopterin S-methyltransferase subunit F